MTIALASERSAKGLREALFAGRTVVWFEELLIGLPEHLGAVVGAILTLESAVRDPGAEVIRVALRNASSAPLRLRHLSTDKQSFHGAAHLVDVAPHSVTELTVKPAAQTDRVALEFEVLNALVGPNTPMTMVLEGEIDVPEATGSFRHEDGPVFTINFAAGSRETAPDGANQVFAGSTPDGVTFHASVADFPAGILLPIEKAAEYFIELTDATGIGADFEVTRNEAIVLGDGTPAYRSEVTWLYLPAAVALRTQIVSAYRDGRLVSITAHARRPGAHIDALVESLRFE